jgi:hypothetical protein
MGLTAEHKPQTIQTLCIFLTEVLIFQAAKKCIEKGPAFRVHGGGFEGNN